MPTHSCHLPGESATQKLSSESLPRDLDRALTVVIVQGKHWQPPHGPARIGDLYALILHEIWTNPALRANKRLEAGRSAAASPAPPGQDPSRVR